MKLDLQPNMIKSSGKLTTFHFLLILLKLTYASYISSPKRNLTGRIFYYTAQHFSQCQIRSASMFEAQKCVCVLLTNDTFENRILSNQLTTKVEHFLVTLLRGGYRKKQLDEQVGCVF